MGETVEGIREGVRETRKSMSRDRIEQKAQDAVDDRPMVRHALDLRSVLLAVAIAAVLTLIVSLLLSPQLGAVVLVLSFAIAWLVLSKRNYERRRPTKPADSEEKEDEDES